MDGWLEGTSCGEVLAEDKVNSSICAVETQTLCPGSLAMNAAPELSTKGDVDADRVQVEVVTVDGQPYTFRCKRTVTVRDLKARLCSLTKTPVQHQRLILDNEILDDDMVTGTWTDSDTLRLTLMKEHVNWKNWKEVASRKPRSWVVPTSIEISPANGIAYDGCGTYYHAPQPFNIDTYRTYSGAWLYYYDPRRGAAWRTTTSLSAGDDGRSCADPDSKCLGNGCQYPAGTRFGKWKGDGSHYRVQGEGHYRMIFHFDENEKSRVGVDWANWSH